MKSPAPSPAPAPASAPAPESSPAAPSQQAAPAEVRGLPAAFRGLAWSNLAAQSAEQISLAAVPMVAVLALGAGPGDIGLLAAVQSLPFLLLSIPAGLLVDRCCLGR